MGPLVVTAQFRSLERAAAGLGVLARELVDTRVLVRAGGEIVVRYLKAEAPVRTGHLRDSIESRPSERGAQIWALGYGQLVVSGTRPHLIRPRQARALRFVVNGNVVFAKVVRHPGTKPNDFPRRAVRKATPALKVLMLQNGRRLVQLVAR